MAVQTDEVAMPTSKTRVIVDTLIGQIEAGTLRPGDWLPSTAELRRQFECSIGPVRRARDELRIRGYVVGVPGVGVYVADRPKG